MPKDKINYRVEVLVMLTRQLQGRANNGGLRIEKWTETA